MTTAKRLICVLLSLALTLCLLPEPTPAAAAPTTTPAPAAAPAAEPETAAAESCFYAGTWSSTAGKGTVYPNPQDAIDAASAWSKAHNDAKAYVLVSVGTYHPTKQGAGGAAASPADRFFSLAKNVAVIGGFEGGEALGVITPTYSQIDPDTTDAQKTIFSGADVTEGSGGRNYSLFYNIGDAAAGELRNAVIEKNVRKNGEYGISVRCGAMQNEYAAVTLTACTIRNNYSVAFMDQMVVYSSGGGVGSENCVTTLIDCIVENNGWRDGKRFASAGGGLYGAFILKGCTIRNNTASSGGGIYGAVTADEHTVITGNEALYGGGVYIAGESEISGPITNNKAEQNGGGAYIAQYATLNGEISNNTTSSSGGGVYVTKNAMLNGEISNNTAAIYGGGAYIMQNATLNGMIKGNRANYDGGGAYIVRDATLNGTVTQNTANNYGGGLYLQSSDQGGEKLTVGKTGRAEKNTAGKGGNSNIHIRMLKNEQIDILAGGFIECKITAIIDGKTLYLSSNFGEIPELAVDEKTDKVVGGWYTDNSLKTPLLNPIYGETTLYGKWQSAVKRNLTYYTAHGEIPLSAPKIYYEGVGAAWLPEPVQDNETESYKFLGWVDDPDKNSSVADPGIGKEVTGDKTLYARWDVAAESQEIIIFDWPSGRKDHYFIRSGETVELDIDAVKFINDSGIEIPLKIQGNYVVFDPSTDVVSFENSGKTVTGTNVGNVDVTVYPREYLYVGRKENLIAATYRKIYVHVYIINPSKNSGDLFEGVNGSEATYYLGYTFPTDAGTPEDIIFLPGHTAVPAGLSATYKEGKFVIKTDGKTPAGDYNLVMQMMVKGNIVTTERFEVTVKGYNAGAQQNVPTEGTASGVTYSVTPKYTTTVKTASLKSASTATGVTLTSYDGNTLTLSTAANTPKGTHTVTVTIDGTDVKLTLLVAAQDKILAVAKQNNGVYTGTGGAVTFTPVHANFTDTATPKPVTLNNAPAGVTVVSPITLDNNTLTLNVASTVAAGTYTMSVTVDGITADFDLVVSPRPVYAIGFVKNNLSEAGIKAIAAVSPSGAQAEGTTVTVTVTLTAIHSVGGASATGWYTVGLTSEVLGAGISAVDPVEIYMPKGMVPSDKTVRFTFTMPAKAVNDLTVVHTFVPHAQTLEVTPEVMDAAIAGAPLPIKLTIKNPDGSVDTLYTADRTVTISGYDVSQTTVHGKFGQSDLTGTKKSFPIRFDAGVAQGTIALNKVDTTYTIKFEVADLTMLEATATITTTYDPNPDNAKVRFLQYPETSNRNGDKLLVQPIVQVEDSYGNIIPTGTITAKPKTSWELGGTTTVDIVNGIAKFTDLYAVYTEANPFAIIDFYCGDSQVICGSAGINILAPPPQQLDVPANVKVTAPGLVSWNAVPNAWSYIIKIYGSDSVLKKTVLNKLGPSYQLTAADISGLTEGTYSVSVTAVGTAAYANSSESQKASGAVIYKVALTTTGITGADSVSFNGSPVTSSKTTEVYVLSGSAVAFSAVAGTYRDVTITGDVTSSGDITNITSNKSVTAKFVQVVTPVSAEAIEGITVPVPDGTPAAEITETNQYTGTVTWTPAVPVPSGTFEPNTVYTAEITLTAKQDYTFEGRFADTSEISGFTVSGAGAPVWVSKDNATLVFTVQFPNTGKRPDNEPPAGTVTVKGKSVTTPETADFKWFFKNAQTVTINPSDNSGEAVTVKYIVSETAMTAEALNAKPDGEWTLYSTPFELQKGKHFIYAELTDTSDNTAIISTCGIVIYEDSVRVTESIAVTKGEATDAPADVTLNGNTISKITNGGAVLTQNTDYTLSGGTITLKADYLNGLAAKTHTLTVHYNPQGAEYPEVPPEGCESPNTTEISLIVSEIATYTVTVTAGTGAAGGGSYRQDAQVSINAGTPPTGKQFKQWTATPAVVFTDANSTVTTFEMPAYDVTVTAEFENIPPTVTGVAVSPSTISVQKGHTQQFSAVVSGTNNPEQSVTWSIVGAAKAGTSITEGGLLTIVADETAATLTVRAASAVSGYTSVYGEAAVTVTDAAPDPVYGISLNTSAHTFPDAAEGYAAQTGLTVTVSNTGNQAAGALSIALSAGLGFELSSASIGDIAVGGHADFTVTPEAGLSIGTHTATVTVSGGNGISGSLTVTFKVTPAALTGTATISSTSPRIGDTLTGSLESGNNTGTLTYTWKSGGSTVHTGESYTVAVSDFGKTITLEITSTVQTGTVLSAATGSVLKKAAPAAPAIPELTSKTHAAVTLTADPVCEFSRDNGTTWQSSPVFTGLTPNTLYTFVRRFAATADTEASQASEGLEVTTNAALTFADNASYDIPASVVGTAIAPVNAAPSVSGGTAPYTFSATGLPSGITISEEGVISGTPTAASETGTATVTVTDSAGETASITIGYGEISNAPVPPVITTPSGALTAGTVGVSYSAALEASNSPAGWLVSAGALPAGLQLSSSGTISGTPSEAGTFNFEVTASNSDGVSLAVSFTITVNKGTQTAPASLGKTDVTAAGNDGTITNVTTAMEYKKEGDPSYTACTGETITGLEPGTYLVRRAETSNYNASPDTQAVIAPYNAPLTFTDNASYDIPASVVGTAIAPVNAAPSVSGGTAPYTFSATGLPSGITISEEGVISGTPTAASEAGTATVTVTDSAGETASITIGYGEISNAPGTVYLLTVSAGPGGSASITAGGPSGSYGQGVQAAVTAVPSDNYTFSHWSSEGGGTFGNANSAVTAFTMPANDVTITAHFTYNAPPAPPAPPEPPTETIVNAEVNGAGIPITQNTETGAVSANLGKAETDKALENAVQTGVVAITIPKTDTIDEKTPVSAVVDSDAMSAIAEKGAALTISAPSLSMTFDADAVGAIAGAGNVEITAGLADTNMLNDRQKDVVGDRPVYEFTVTAGGNAVRELGGSASVSIPYTPKDDEDPNAIVIYYIDADGNIKTIPGGMYDPVTGKVTFITNHFSLYMVAYSTVTFTDVLSDHWAQNYITFVAARKIMNTTDSEQFSPGASMTRAMFAAALSNLGGADLSLYQTSRFSDVEAGQWYAASVEWAASNGIVSGVGDEQFDPQAEITREQMALILYNYMKYKGYTIPNASAEDFKDENMISTWAYDAVKAIQQTGIVTGRPGNLYDPQATATRAEVAAIFARFVEYLTRA